eukprot:TRINITY_DN39604_c0_g1_i1.p1 TRINITY_DN39604_c0_g1~~TRINITY_DN39604_c0_g1_i1.p1  ORF type:complete len:219 (+),score=33.14 TRINITY_DN39604_c0_g1_i1:44-658(+)
MASPQQGVLSFQVAVIGGAGAGKTTLLKVAAKDACVNSLVGEDDADNFRMQRLGCNYEGLRLSIDLLELPADERYLPLLPQFGVAAACVICAANLADSGACADLKNRLAGLGSPPLCGIVVVQGSIHFGVIDGPSEERRRLEELRNLALRFGLEFLRVETLEGLEHCRVLQMVNSMVLRGVSADSDPMHMLGRRISQGQSFERD